MRPRTRIRLKRLREVLERPSLSFGNWTLRNVGLAILGAAIVGICLSVGLVIGAYRLFCVWFPATCVAAQENPPWVVLTGLASGPSLLLIWYWRTRHRKDEVRIAQESQVTERFVAAVKLLSETRDAARIGGIYALRRIALDSEDDKPTVVRTLSAFIRDKVERLPLEEAHKDSRQLKSDIEDALNVLAEEKMGGAFFVRACLERANLVKAELDCANFECADLKEANLERAHLIRANFRRANLSGAILEGTNPIESNFVGAILSEATLSHANVVGANFVGAILTGANLSGANLGGVHFVTANLDGADLSGAHLDGADFREANVSGADLSGAILEGDIYGGATLERAKYNDQTKFPKGFDPEAHGMVKVGEEEDEDGDDKPV